jgi:hypothetical protein
MSIGRDPGGTTPEKTGVLCSTCNRKNMTDKSAQGAFDLANAAIIGDMSFDPDRSRHPYFTRHYVTNVVKHGVPTRGCLSAQEQQVLKGRFDEARLCCSAILKEEILALKPVLIKPSGKDAASSLQQMGILPERSLIDLVERSPHRLKDYYGPGKDLLIFCLYHQAIKVTNMTLPRYYSDSVMDEIQELKKGHPGPAAVEAFIRKYQGVSETTRRGMMVHLKHWLRLGKLLRDMKEL